MKNNNNNKTIRVGVGVLVINSEGKILLGRRKKIELVIQINGKIRDQIKTSANITEDEARKIALSSDKIKKWIKGKEIRKVMFVKGRLINIVI